MNFILGILNETWQLFLESSIYILFGLVISGLLRTFLNPSSVARHLGQGKIVSVIKASLLGVLLAFSLACAGERSLVERHENAFPHPCEGRAARHLRAG